MGLPVVTVKGETFLSRASLSVLSACGLADYAAADMAAYVDICRQLATDLPALAALRSGLRGQLQASPLLDAPAFARDIEAAYRAMWMQWCDSEAADPIAGTSS